MRNRFLTLLSAVMVSIGSLYAEIYDGTCGDNLTWSLNTETGILTIEGEGDMTNWDIFENSMAPWSYDISSYISSISISEGVTSIGNCAFFSLQDLSTISIPNSVTHIGDYAFMHCYTLTNIEIPLGVKTFGDRVFENSNLTEVVWNARKCSDFSFDSSPFYYNGNASVCGNITSLTFGESIEYIPAYLCYGMDMLTSIEIPNSVDSIGDNAFYGCSKLNSLVLGSNVRNIGKYAFYQCSSLESIDIPNSVVSIESDAFALCSKLASISLPIVLQV